MAKYQILYWFDIPVQVRAQDRDGRVSLPLPDRFQVAIDKAAMEAELTGTDAYLDIFRWGEHLEQDGSAQEVAGRVVEELSARYETIDWRQTVASLRRSDQA
jgi:hypothetical protein